MDVTIVDDNPWKGPFLGGIVLLVIGLLFVVGGDDVLKWILIVAGVLMAVGGTLSLLNGIKNHFTMTIVTGVIGLVMGIVLVVAANLWANLLMTFLGLFLIIIGLISVLNIGNTFHFSNGSKAISVIVGVLMIGLGILTILEPSSVAEFIFVLIGVFMMVAGGLTMYDAYTAKNN